MPAANDGQRHFLAALLLILGLHVLSCAAVRAADGASPEQTCATYYRLDDVTEWNDEIRRCLIASEAANFRLRRRPVVDNAL
ncbi:hypothetical protein CDD83_1373 [Cordyceps sp. RAO-2017]|nr:hypothetical protein CDD83_1373 [Cordyceps sp. RAO-2017]